MLMCANRRLPQYIKNQQKPLWQAMGSIRSIEGSAILTLGLGDIGGDFARKVKALGAYVIGVRRNIAQKPDYIDEIHAMDDLDVLLPRADVVVICLPSTQETIHLFDEARIRLMRKDAILINIGRGNIVDTDGLYRVLKDDGLYCACLDVTDPEPLPLDHPIWQCENAMITPHVAGNFHLPETLNRVVGIACENLRRFANGEELKNLVIHE